MTSVEIAAIAAAVLLGVVVAFQLSLALRAPLGEATMGGRARTTDGVLEPPFRVMAAASAVILGVAAWVVLARAGAIDPGPVKHAEKPVRNGVVAAFTALNILSSAGAWAPSRSSSRCWLPMLRWLHRNLA